MGRQQAEMPGVAHPPVYPENLTLGNLAYFLVAPTLVYQVAYPRSSRFRLRWTLWCDARSTARRTTVVDLF